MISDKMQEFNPYLYFSFLTYPCPYYLSTPQPGHQVAFCGQMPTAEELPMLSLESLPLITQNTKVKQEEPSPQELPPRDQIMPTQIKPSVRGSVKKCKKRRYSMSKRKSQSTCCSYELKNGTSNILRNFFRSLIELNHYDTLIRKTFARLRIHNSIQEFYQWLRSYRINTQKFIRRALVFQILEDTHHQSFRVALRIIFYRFLREQSMNRILTTTRFCFKKSQLLGRRVLLRTMAESF